MKFAATLTDILARVDALFIAPRRYRDARPFSLRAAAGIDERRQRNLTGDGLPYLIGGDAAERQQGARLLDELATMGAVELTTRGGRRSGLRLTEGGDSVARALVAAFDVQHAWRLLTTLGELAVTTHLHWVGAAWVRETALAESLGTNIAGIEFLSLPLKQRGLVADGIDQDGRVAYSLTAAGLEAATADPPAPPATLPAMDDTLADEYTAKIERYADERAAWKPEQPGRLYVPLPVSFPPCGSLRDETA